jgi:hypothetical protein
MAREETYMDALHGEAIEWERLKYRVEPDHVVAADYISQGLYDLKRGADLGYLRKGLEEALLYLARSMEDAAKVVTRKIG